MPWEQNCSPASAKHFWGGDNTLLEAVLNYLETEGFRIVGADEVLATLLAPKGLLGKIRPTKDAEADIAKGVPIVHAVGNLDIGQSIVMQKGYVLGVEAAEGTDNLILRCGELRRPSPYGGVLIKAKKPHQERRIDLPTIGPDTVLNAAKAGLSGIAVEAGGTLILDRKEVSLKADALGLFIVGFTLHDEDNA